MTAMTIGHMRHGVGGRYRPLPLGLVAALIATLGAARPAHAQLWAYGSSQTGIYRVNTSTGAATLIYSGTPFPAAANVAGLAQRPSDGMLFFIVGSSGNDAVYRWDPATPATAAVLLGTTGAAVPYMPRLGFDPATGNLYGIDVNTTRLYTVNQASGAATATGAALTGAPAGQTGGDLAFHPTTGFIYLPTGTTSPYTLYRLAVTGGAMTNAGSITGLPGAPSGAAFSAGGTLYVQSSSSNNFYTVPLTGGAATLVGNSGTALQDLATLPVATPTASVAFLPTTIGQNGTSTLTITLTNSAAVQQRGAAFTLTYPANQVNAATPAGATTCGGTVTAAAGGNSVVLASGTIPASSSCTVTVSVTSATVASYVNTLAAGAVTTVIGANTAAASGTLTVIPRADLSVTKTDSVTSVPQGGTVKYTIIVKNLGPSAVTAATLTDPFPAQVSSVTWTCAASAGSTCPASGSGNIAASMNLAVNGTATFTATATATGTGTISNTATATPPAGVDDPSGNSSATDNNTAIVVYGVSVTPDGVDTIPRLPSGGSGRYSYAFTLTNTSGAAESFDLLASAGPAGAYLTIDSITGSGVTRGAPPDSARLTAVGAGASAGVTVWYRAGSAATGTLDTVRLLGRSLVRPTTARDSGWSLTRLARPSLILDKSATPTGSVTPGTQVTYRIDITNAGTEQAVSVVAVDSVAPQTVFKVGSTSSTLPSGVSVTVAYSNDGGTTWTYTPASGACAAPVGFDACVNRIRWSFLNPLSNASGSNAASFSFIARVK